MRNACDLLSGTLALLTWHTTNCTFTKLNILSHGVHPCIWTLYKPLLHVSHFFNISYDRPLFYFEVIKTTIPIVARSQKPMHSYNLLLKRYNNGYYTKTQTLVLTNIIHGYIDVWQHYTRYLPDLCENKSQA